MRTLAFWGGRKGVPLFFNYYTIRKLFSKSSVVSSSTTGIFNLAPEINLAAVILALLFLPLANCPSPLAFNGDALVVLYFLGLGRFFLILGALDTASSFEGMGVAREVFFGLLGEVTLFLILILFYPLTHEISLSSIAIQGKANLYAHASVFPLLLVVLALFILLLLENSRVPVDDPNTHLELTMIHEVMVLDYSGPQLAIIHITAYLKMLFWVVLIANMLIPIAISSWILSVAFLIGLILLIYLVIGVVESMTARLAMRKVPKFVLSAFVLVVLATILTWRKV